MKTKTNPSKTTKRADAKPLTQSQKNKAALSRLAKKLRVPQKVALHAAVSHLAREVKAGRIVSMRVPLSFELVSKLREMARNKGVAKEILFSDMVASYARKLEVQK